MMVVMKRLLYLLSLIALLRPLSSAASNELFMSDVIFTPQGTGELRLHISNASDITAFQMILHLPEGIVCRDAALTARAAKDHRVACSQREDGSWFVGCWSASNQTFALDRGEVCTLLLAKDISVYAGRYACDAAQMTLFFSDGGRTTGTGTATAAIYVGTTPSAESEYEWMPESSPSQVYTITNTASALMLRCDDATGCLTAVKGSNPDADSGFFIEPALDREGNRWYLRSLSGHYLTPIMEDGVAKLKLAATPERDAAFRMTETGRGEYGLCFAWDEESIWMQFQGKYDPVVTAGVQDATSGWRLKAIPEECPKAYIAHLLETAGTQVGLTQCASDMNLRLLIHSIQRAIEGSETVADADSLINALSVAVKAAQHSFACGDTSIADVPWGVPETFPTGDYAVFVEEDAHDVRFLSSSEDSLFLSPMPTAFTAEVKNLYYNPLSDRYALRLSGADATDEGDYLACSPTMDSLFIGSRDMGEALRIWGIMPLAEAIRRYMSLEGKCGTNIHWRYETETSTLFLNGTGRTTYYTAADQTPWHLYSSQIRHVVLAGEITQLGSWLFAGCSALTRLSVTAKTPAGYEATTFDGVPDGLQIFAVYPSGYTHFLDGCTAQPIATLRDSYTYTAKPAIPEVACDFPATVQTTAMQTDVGEYSASGSFRVTIEGKTYAFAATCPYRILPAGIIATTRAYSRNYGAANPTFYVTFEGFLGDDNEKTIIATRPTATCTADKKSPVGEYAITLSGGEIQNPNYTWHYRPSVLHVKEAPLRVIADDATRQQGEANPPLTYHCSGFVNDEDESVFTERPVLTTDADEESTPGKYYIVVSEGYAPNYSLRYYSGILTVEPSANVHPEIDELDDTIMHDLSGRSVEKIEGYQTTLQGMFIVNGKKKLIK